MPTITKFSHEDADLVGLAADMAWGALKGWYGARDLRVPVTSKQCADQAEDVLREWEGRVVDDIAEAVAVEVLSRNHFRVIDSTAWLIEKKH